MYPHFTGTVIHGKQLGKKLGFPTANMNYVAESLPTGTYKINIVYNETLYHGVGTYFSEKNLFEAHIFGFTKDIYGEELTIYPLHKIRENQKFEQMDQLISQIEKDVLRAYQNQRTVLTFGTFDHFHPGHTYYLSEAKKYGDRLVTVIARDQTVEKIKGKLPTNPEKTRKTSVINSGIPDAVVLGDTKFHYKCIDDFLPNIVCLGYDQHSFDDRLQAYFDEKNMDTKIVRLPSFEPERRKSSLMKNS